MKSRFPSKFWFVIGPSVIGMTVGAAGVVFLFSFVFACEKTVHAGTRVSEFRALSHHDSIFGTDFSKKPR